MDTVGEVSRELQIPLAYLKRTSRKDRVIAVVHRSWLNALVKNQLVPEFVHHETLSSEEVQAWIHQGDDLGVAWNKVLIKVFRKGQKKVIPLPRPRPVPSKFEPDLSFAQVLHYVSQTNHKNLWKEAFKKYLNGSVPTEEKSNQSIGFVSCESVMRDIIQRMYGCPVVRTGSDLGGDASPGGVGGDGLKGRHCEAHSNVLPAVCAVETRRSLLVIHRSCPDHTVLDCVTFSPALLGSSNMKPLFIIYQLLHAMRDMHDRGMILGDITLADVLLSENLWIQILPRLEDNIHDEPRPKSKCPKKFTVSKEVQSTVYLNGESPDDPSNVGRTCDRRSPCDIDQHDSDGCEQTCGGKVVGSFDVSRKSFRCDSDGTSCELKRLCELWVRGQLSNFDYLMALNDWAGRKYGDPTSHYVMPWVTDFAYQSGLHWRDLCRSKYRLNKGDKQLDFTYDTASNGTQIPHHVSDVLSEITYYVYLARRTPKSVLCKYVRSRWVPAEYPLSIQRLQAWTPDECIPEFFSDPAVFKSIHEDMLDLEVPSWAHSVQDFIDWHRDILESPHVSERLHHWIDLTFGYKLSGAAAVKAKNVCLQLVDSHTALTNTGVVQLFAHPHPQRLMPSPFWGKTPPKMHPTPKEKKRGWERTNEDEVQSSGLEEDDMTSTFSQNTSRSSPLALSRLLSRSRGSLQVSGQSCEEGSPRLPAGAEPHKQVTNGSSAQTIYLPKDFNPLAAMQVVESQHSFLMKTFHQGPEVDWFSRAARAGPTTGFMQVVATRRIREMQVLGCLIVELFLSSKLRALDSYNSACFDQRVEACHSVLRWSGDSLPHCVKHIISLLLQVNLESSQEMGVGTGEGRTAGVHPFRYPTVTQQGLPPPSAHQLLQPLLFSAALPFPRYFPHLFKLLEVLNDYESMMDELALDDGVPAEHDLAYKAQLSGKVAECRVKTAGRELSVLLPQMSAESLGILLPYVVRLLDDPSTSVLAAWYLFDPVATVLGPAETAEHLLLPVVSLYGYKEETSADSCNKHLKLYHHSFLLQLVVRLGLRVFLKNFVTPLVEAVGGYRDLGHFEGTSQHERADLRSSTSHLKTCEIEENIGEADADADEILSPLDEDFSTESDHRNMHQEEANGKEFNENSKNCISDFEDSGPGVAEDGKVSPAEEEAGLYSIMAQLDLAIPHTCSEGEAETEDTLPINCHDETLSGLMDDLGDQPEESTQDQLSVEIESVEQFAEDDVRKDDGFQRVNSQCKVSDMSADSLVWLSHRLGPVLSARHLSRNLLRMLALCYLGRENLRPAGSSHGHTLSITSTVLPGDHNAAKVVECLSSIATLYGEQFIVLQYLPHMGELIGLCKKKLTYALEGGLVGALSLLSCIVPYLSDTALMDHLQEVLLKNILHPALRLLSTTRFVFPSGDVGRAAVAAKFVDALYVIAQRIGQEMTKKHLAAPSLQRFFLAFDKAYERLVPEHSAQTSSRAAEPANSSPSHSGGKNSAAMAGLDSAEVADGVHYRSPADCNYLEICRDGSSIEWAVRGSSVQVRLRENDFGDSFSPPSSSGPDQEWRSLDPTRSKAVEELKAVFTPRLAHLSYLPFVVFLGDNVMDQCLKNAEFIAELCFKYEKEMQGEESSSCSMEVFYLSDYLGLGGLQVEEKSDTGSLGSNVSMVGNRIDLQRTDIPSAQLPQVVGCKKVPASVPDDVMSLISRKMENTKRHLRGNWLAYWEHEIGRAEKDTRFNFKQIKLQTFSGHNNSVRALYVLNNENSFISGSRDKTVKLWSLRSQGDGNAVSHCQWTYMGHRKSVVGLTFVESLQLVASCDYGVHVWDPFMGSTVGTLESARHPQVNVLRAMPSPSTSFLAATTDVVALRLVDARTCSYVNELRVSVNPAGYIRCVTVGPSGNWVAVGQSTGFLTILDIRTGMVVASWKGHEGEVLQLVSPNDKNIISSSLDQTVSVWSSSDGKHLYHMKGPTEPVHCLSVYGSELISGTTANRIGVHTAVDEAASFSSTRLRSDTFRGVLTTMAVLPLNRLLLLGADSGNISLLC